MKHTSGSSDFAVAEEVFSPMLSDEFRIEFMQICHDLKNAPITYRNTYLKKKIEELSTNRNSLSLDYLKYIASLNVLKDLLLQGWDLNIVEGRVMLRLESENLSKKDNIRYRLKPERDAQFTEQAVRLFIEKLENERKYRGKCVSIKDLVGNPLSIIEKIHNNETICEPYIQLVSEERDEYTGIRLSEIWRYFRYTWAIPYKTMPGRNLFYLVRDRSQTFHPIIGIFALGNSVLNLTKRDDDIGWTIQAIKKVISEQEEVTHCEEFVAGSKGKTIKVKITHKTETLDEYASRIEMYANEIMPLLEKNINDSISDIYTQDLGYAKQTRYPKPEEVTSLLSIAEESNKKAINNKNNDCNPNWKEEAKSNLFVRKRSSELAKLLVAKMEFVSHRDKTNIEKLQTMLSSEGGRKAINTSLIANRKCKIGSNMMEIIVCGAIPPYNELLGGKLVSMLACSPIVIRDYTKKYANQISVIASRMKGAKVIRDSHLVFLGTTSLYSVGSSQYNRINVPLNSDFSLKYRELGVTEGFGSVYFSSETTKLFSQILEIIDGGKRINHVFGEGTSPRFRMISRGLKEIGLNSSSFLKHYSPRIVYSINLAKNTKRFLMGLDKVPEYGYNIDDNEEVERVTQQIIDFWYKRWLTMRLSSVNIEERLAFKDKDAIILSRHF